MSMWHLVPINLLLVKLFHQMYRYLVHQIGEDGMGSTISTSLNQIDLEKYQAIILSMCDQPYLSDEVFNNLLTEFEKGESTIVVSLYKKSSGPPTLFGRKLYEHLLKLKGHHGAKSIVKHYHKEVASIQFEKGEIDIDTEKDLRKLLGSKIHLK